MLSLLIPKTVLYNGNIIFNKYYKLYIRVIILYNI